MAQYGRPNSDISVGSFTPSTGATLYGVIDESSPDDADYISSTVTTQCEIKLSSVTDPVSSSTHIFRYRARRVLASGSTLTVSLKQGASTIATDSSKSLSTTFTTYEYTLSAGEANSITDYSDLRLYFSFVKAGADGYGVVTWGEMEFPDAPVITTRRIFIV